MNNKISLKEFKEQIIDLIYEVMEEELEALADNNKSLNKVSEEDIEAEANLDPNRPWDKNSLNSQARRIYAQRKRDANREKAKTSGYGKVRDDREVPSGLYRDSLGNIAGTLD